MNTSKSWRPALVAATLAMLTALLLVPTSAMGVARILDIHEGKADLDTRKGAIQPTAAQKQAVANLGARATWNRFGTPSSLIKYGGWLASGLGDDPVQAARAFIDSNRGLFKLSSVDTLELVNAGPFEGTNAHAVVFAQRFGDLVANWDGLISVGVANGKVAYVSSSLAGDQTVTGAVRLSAVEAWAAAARNVGVPTGAVGNLMHKEGWTYFDVAGLSRNAQTTKSQVVLPQLPPLPTLPPLPGLPGAGPGSGGQTVDTNPLAQQLLARIRALLGKKAVTGGAASTPASVGIHQGAKLVAFPTVKNGVRPAWLVNVIDLRKASVRAYQTMVDAESGAILFRRNAVQHADDETAAPQPFVFQGATGATGCAEKHTFAIGGGQKSIAALGSYVVANNDAVVKLYNPAGQVVASQDTGTSPEPVYYEMENSGTLPEGTWAVQMCAFGPTSIVPQTGPYAYVIVGAVTPLQLPVLPGVVRPPLPQLPESAAWKFFPSFPSTTYSNDADVRTIGCWLNAQDPQTSLLGCDPAWTFNSSSSLYGWDVLPRTNNSTYTTRGNNAFTAQAWVSPLTPSENISPLAPLGGNTRMRNYRFEWTNQWQKEGCNPAVFASAQRNDVDAATTNLFVMHNRMHDFAYPLGFTERWWNAQLDNIDQGIRPIGPYPFGREDDPEVGDAQAGAISGGSPSYEGRDNANQITLNDGTPPITNQYLWQPIAGAFYAPCVDGSFDMGIAGHEYTHLISNRLVGGPDAGLTGLQAGSMGESWSDLVALELLLEYGLAGKQGENPWSLGAYATGNKQRGIRDYALNANPLNYSNVGFDTTGPEVHADGEIWNAVNYAIRQGLVDKWGGGDAATNIVCARNEKPAEECPGGRRWIQIVFDAFRLQQADTSFVTARDAYLAADMLRFGGANQAALWRGFAATGLGIGAATDGTNDDQPIPSFESPAEANATVTFATEAADAADANVKTPKAKIYVGDYEARVTPIADTDPGTARGDTAKFIPGTYHFVVQANGFGLVRLTRTLGAGATTLTISMPVNWASKTQGASASGDGVNHAKLIDDSESTNWASLSGDVGGKTVNLSLKGRHLVRQLRVSALLHPGLCHGVAVVNGECVGGESDDPDDPDQGSQNRFSAVRSFKVLACDQLKPANCDSDDFDLVYTSPANAFPAVAPRPVAPDLNLRTFDVPDFYATKLKFVVVANQCTGGPAFQGEQDHDPTNDTDCDDISAQWNKVRVAELELVSTGASVEAGSSGSGGSNGVAGSSTAGGSTGAAGGTGSPASGGASGGAGGGTVVTVVGSPTANTARPVVGSGIAGVRATKLVTLKAAGAIRGVAGAGRARFSLTFGGGRAAAVAFTSGKVAFRATKIATVRVDYRKHTAALRGIGKLNGKTTSFTVVLVDRAGVDTFSLRLGSGYFNHGRLVSGAVTIR